MDTKGLKGGFTRPSTRPKFQSPVSGSQRSRGEKKPHGQQKTVASSQRGERGGKKEKDQRRPPWPHENDTSENWEKLKCLKDGAGEGQRLHTNRETGAASKRNPDGGKGTTP